ncbi:MAG: histidine phosphatase family protein [bacterium]|nr:histidine phosphatase family protein [bacterium]
MKSYKIFSCILLFVLVNNSVFGFQKKPIQADETLLIFVRHTEKADDGTRNPPLSFEGIERANALVSKLVNTPLAAIYSTDYKRTIMTATPTAFHFELPVLTYDFSNLDAFLDGVIAENRGKAVLIVGHSNTTPRLINMVLREDKLSQIDEKQYGDLFWVYIKSMGEGELTVSSF